jgi:hypothetical protein
MSFSGDHVKQPFQILLFSALLVIATLAPAWSETAASENSSLPNLNGEWKVTLENSNGRKLVRFLVDEKDGRLRGKMNSRDTGAQDLDGRQEDDGKILFWSTFKTREGASVEISFKGKLEGEAIVGDARYFEKPYKFRAVRVEKEKAPE